MKKSLRILILAASALVSVAALTSTALAANAPADAAGQYSVDTTNVGKLLDDPAANAVLKKMIPSVYGNDMFQTMGRELTLRAIQQYEPEALSEANLAKLQAELAKLPVKK